MKLIDDMSVALYEAKEGAGSWLCADLHERAEAKKQVMALLQWATANGLMLCRDPSEKAMINEVATKLGHPHNDAAMADAKDAVKVCRRMITYA